MNPAHNISIAFRRIASIVGIHSVRDDEALREQRQGASVADLRKATVAFAEEMDRKALEARRLL